MRTRYRRRSARIQWLSRRTKNGTVYLMVSLDNPGLFKIGFTERLTTDRRRELERSSGERLTIAHSVSMPWAYATEQRLHRYYRNRLWGSARELGTEWFQLRRWESLGGVRKRMDRAARLTEWEARLKLSWREGAEIRSFTNGRIFEDPEPRPSNKVPNGRNVS